MEKISVIIPVYKVEKYLGQCLDSIYAQSFDNLEIIVVDDGSPDGSGLIADEYALKDQRVRVIHKDNGGAAAARNAGLDFCTGDYIVFVDSDDWIEEDMIQRLYDVLKSEDCDIVQCQYYDEYKDRSVLHQFMERDGLFTDEEFIKDMIPHWEDIVIWNKLYKSSVIKNVRFEEGHCIDDEFFTYKVIMNSSKIFMIKDALYHYRARRSSAMQNRDKMKQRYEDQISFITERYGLLVKRYPSLKSELLYHMAEVLMSVMRGRAEFPDTFNKARSYLKKYLLDVLVDKGIVLGNKKAVVSYLLKKRESFIVKEVSNKEDSSDLFE